MQTASKNSTAMTLTTAKITLATTVVAPLPTGHIILLHVELTLDKWSHNYFNLQRTAMK